MRLPWCPRRAGTNCPGRIVTLFTSQKDTSSGILAAELVMFTMLYKTQEFPARRFSIMSSRTLYRLSSMSLLIGGLLTALGVIPVFFTGDDSTSTIAATAALLRVLGGMLIVSGLPGMYQSPYPSATALS